LNFRLWAVLWNENLVYWNSIPMTTAGTLHSK